MYQDSTAQTTVSLPDIKIQIALPTLKYRCKTAMRVKYGPHFININSGSNFCHPLAKGEGLLYCGNR